MTRRSGFTLAEVLITLGIIGVVAAMTIPTLISNTNGAKFRSQFKKTLSTLNQAGLMAQAQYDFDFSTASGTCESSTDTPDKMTFCGLLNGTLTGYSYIGASSNLTTSSGDEYKWQNSNGQSITIGAASDYVLYSLADGSIIGFKAIANTSSARFTCNDSIERRNDIASNLTRATWSPCLGFIDVNGATLPNKEVTCETVEDTGLTGGEVGVDNEGNGGRPTGSCVVPNNANNMTDVFPIVFHDATVEPATNAARYVLNTAK